MAVAADAGRAWAVLGDLQSAERWIDGIEQVEVDGMSRVCTFPGGAQQFETISNYSASERRFDYSIEGGPLPLRWHTGSFQVKPESNASSVIEWVADLAFADGAPAEALEPMVLQAFEQTANNLRRVIEAS